jgi:3-deoxy-7-phosphoheptulonate synthase
MILVLKQVSATKPKSASGPNCSRKGACCGKSTAATKVSSLPSATVDLAVETLMAMDGVAEVIPMTSKFKLVSRQWHPHDSRVQVGPITIGGERIVLVAGPCAVEEPWSRR